MRQAIAKAEVGDEQRGLDPTTRALEERVAELLGQEAAVFLPSGTMCNEIAFRLHIRPGGDEVILDRTLHPVNFEAGGPAQLSGVMIRTLEGDGGMFTPTSSRGRSGRTAAATRPGRDLCRWSRRATSAAAGSGRSKRPECSGRPHHGLRSHLDGARLMNAVVASGVPRPTMRGVRHGLDRFHQRPRRPGRGGAGRLPRADRRGVALEADARRGASPVRHRGRGLPVRARAPRRPPGRGSRKTHAGSPRGWRAARGRARPRRRCRPTS